MSSKERDKRNSTVQELVLEGDPYSKVFIVPMKYSAISKILDCDEYMDNVYQTLKAYGLEKDESRKYLLFD